MSLLTGFRGEYIIVNNTTKKVPEKRKDTLGLYTDVSAFQLHWILRRSAISTVARHFKWGLHND